jgi:hypothetical protein
LKKTYGSRSRHNLAETRLCRSADQLAIGEALGNAKNGDSTSTSGVAAGEEVFVALTNKFTLAVQSLAAACLFAQPLAVLAQSAPSDLAFETGDFMRRTAYRNVAKLNTEDAPDGAYGAVNRAWDISHSGKWYIEEQRYGGDAVSGGIAAHDTDAISRGLRVLKWGFRQQQPDGSFDCPDSFHSTSFFVEATAHSLLLLEKSEYAGRYSAETADLEPRLLKSALWMIRSDVEEAGKRHNQPYTHRRYLVACALGETGVLVHNERLLQKSRQYIEEGLSLQDPSGYNPEKGGADTSYHAVGTLFAERYYTIVAEGAIKSRLYAMLQKAVRWEASRINPDGTVDTTGNTRVGGAETEAGRGGKPKTIAVGQVFRCFEYWALISGDKTYEALAYKVAMAAHMYSGK